MNDGPNSFSYIWVCLDDVPRNFQPLDPRANFGRDSSFGLKDIFLCIANLHNSDERLRALETSIQNWCSDVDTEAPDITPLKKNLTSIVGAQCAELFASYICIFFIEKMSADDIYMHIETACMVADHFASCLCAPNQIRPSGMENQDIVTAVIGTFDDFGRAFKLRYRPVMGYCGDKFTYLNSVIFKDIMSIVNIAALSILRDNSVIRKCQNCGEYFVPISRSDEIYCGKMLPNGKTCKTIGYDERVKTDDILREYRKIYKTQNARKQRNQHKKNISEKFQQWVLFAKKEVSRCKSGEISIDEMVSAISLSDWMQ